MLRLTLGTVAFLATTAPAFAGVVVPVPFEEAGAGLAAMAALGLGVTWLRKRRQR